MVPSRVRAARLTGQEPGDALCPVQPERDWTAGG